MGILAQELDDLFKHTCQCFLFIEMVLVASIAARLVQTDQGALLLRRSWRRCRGLQQRGQLSSAGRTCGCRRRRSGVHPAGRTSCLFRVVAWRTAHNRGQSTM